MATMGFTEDTDVKNVIFCKITLSAVPFKHAHEQIISFLSLPFPVCKIFRSQSKGKTKSNWKKNKMKGRVAGNGQKR